MTAWLRTGRSLPEFWSQTPRTMALALKAHSELREATRRESLSLAWHIAKLTKASRIPPLKQLLADPPTTVVQTPNQMRAAFAAWRANG